MPSLIVPTTKQWGKVDKATLHQLIIKGKVDIEDLATENIDAAHMHWFPHWQRCNFWQNFKDFSAAFDFE